MAHEVHVPQYYNRREYKELRQKLRRVMPLAEVILWQQLQGRRFEGLKFRRQYGVDGYIIDFYCPQLRLAIEVDGDTHRDSKKDELRSRFIEDFGIAIVRFTNDEVMNNLEEVLKQLSTICARMKRRTTTPTPSLFKEGTH